MKKLILFLSIIVLLTGCYEGLKSNKPTDFTIVKITSVETPDYKISRYQVQFKAGIRGANVWFTDSIGKYNVGDKLMFVKK